MAESSHCDWPRGPGHILPQGRYFKDPKRHNLAFGIALWIQEMKRLQLTQKNAPVKKELLDCPFSSVPISASQALELCTLPAICMYGLILLQSGESTCQFEISKIPPSKVLEQKERAGHHLPLAACAHPGAIQSLCTFPFFPLQTQDPKQFTDCSHT